MGLTKKILGINILILVVYTLLIGIMSELISAGILCFIHSIVCVFVAIFFFLLKKKEIGRGFLLSGLVVFLISMSVCSTALV